MKSHGLENIQFMRINDASLPSTAQEGNRLQKKNPGEFEFERNWRKKIAFTTRFPLQSLINGLWRGVVACVHSCRKCFSKSKGTELLGAILI